MEGDFKSVALDLDFADEEGVWGKKVQRVKVNTPTLKDKSTGFSSCHRKAVYTLSFTVSIPKAIHTYLIGKSVPDKRGDGTRDYDKDTPKSLNGTSIENLTEQWSELIEDYVWLKKIAKAKLVKVIFYNFITNHGGYKSTWDGTTFGEQAELKYNYAIGYVAEVNGRELRYNSIKQVISTSSDRPFYTKKYVKWTEEREEFFKGIQTSFEVIATKLTMFDDNLTEETVNELMTRSPLALGSKN